jgi:putative peptidoglycan lipid II flippase
VAGVSAVLLVSVAAAIRSAGDGGSSPDAGRKPGLAAPAGPLAEPTALPATSFDPEGDKEENQPSAANVADSDPATVWKSDKYVDNFPKLKSGVGIYVDLGKNRKVRTVKLTGATGYAAQIYVADRPGSDLAGWGKTRTAGGTGTFDVGGVQGRYVLVWFTSLPQTDGGYKVEVSEISVDDS